MGDYSGGFIYRKVQLLTKERIFNPVIVIIISMETKITNNHIYLPSLPSLPDIIPPIIDIVPDHPQRTLRHLLIRLLQQRLPRRQRLLLRKLTLFPL